MKKNDNLGALPSTGETKVGGEDDLEVKQVLRETEYRQKKNKNKEE